MNLLAGNSPSWQASETHNSANITHGVHVIYIVTCIQCTCRYYVTCVKAQLMAAGNNGNTEEIYS